MTKESTTANPCGWGWIRLVLLTDFVAPGRCTRLMPVELCAMTCSAVVLSRCDRAVEGGPFGKVEGVPQAVQIDRRLAL